MKKIIKIAAPVLVLAMAGGAYWFDYGRYIQSTDNAYVNTDITNVSAKISAEITQVDVQDNQKVKKGQLLAVLDDREYVIQVNTEKATLAQSEAQVSNAQAAYQMQLSSIKEYESDVYAAKVKYNNALKQYKRIQALEKEQYVSTVDKDNSESTLKVAKATYIQTQASLKTQQDKLAVLKSSIQQADALVKQSKADLAQAELQLSYTQIIAPISGYVSNRDLHVGMMVQAGQSVLSIVSSQPPWIEANFKETQTANMHAGQAVDITLDAYPGKAFKGKIQSLSHATSETFAILPPTDSTGNFTKVVQLVPVKIVFDKPIVLDNGLSAEVTVNTRS
ncbi:HlyD family secretion protein [Vibrio sp. S4M6]|uniref:HlyD family secretion protein n=1 Tax=Vibrio sinus TaxID=2946865 RepID=UPI00202AACC4|nr:HlyD family secretion protein [Vibrio sinus]MCL9779883.1 HlyD family secretion protein [Vibrio sinus]